MCWGSAWYTDRSDPISFGDPAGPNGAREQTTATPATRQEANSGETCKWYIGFLRRRTAGAQLPRRGELGTCLINEAALQTRPSAFPTKVSPNDPAQQRPPPQ